MQALLAPRPTEQLQRLPYERVVRARDGDRGRKTLEVGSVSWCPSIILTTIGWLIASPPTKDGCGPG
jgi:hypothetical protein